MNTQRVGVELVCPILRMVRQRGHWFHVKSMASRVLRADRGSTCSAGDTRTLDPAILVVSWPYFGDWRR
jgi:hypothetical protein